MRNRLDKMTAGSFGGQKRAHLPNRAGNCRGRPEVQRLSLKKEHTPTEKGMLKMLRSAASPACSAWRFQENRAASASADRITDGRAVLFQQRLHPAEGHAPDVLPGRCRDGSGGARRLSQAADNGHNPDRSLRFVGG